MCLHCQCLGVQCHISLLSQLYIFVIMQLSVPLLPYHVDIVVFSFIARQYADARY